MLLNDKSEFNTSLMNLFSLYGKEPNPEIYSMWFSLLDEYSLPEIKKAFAGYAKNQKYPPIPAGVIEYLPKQKVLTAEEAWSHVPKTEYQGGWVTSRMMSALGVVEELLCDGDTIGARIAFVKSYNNTPDDGKWFYSEAYNVPYEEKAQRKFDDYKLLENKGWIQKDEKIKQPMIENGLNKMQTESNEKQACKLRLITKEMLNSNRIDIGKG